MHIGHYISGSAHLGLLSWLLIGGVFSSSQLPIEVRNVSVVSLSDYADMMITDVAPEVEQQAQDLMQPAAQADPLPEPPSEEQAVDDIKQPGAIEQPDDPLRSAPQTPEPLDIPAPEVVEPIDLAQPETRDSAFIVPRSAPAPRPQPDKRIAPKPFAPPPPDAVLDDQLRQAAAPSDNPAAVPQPEVDATAPEEAVRETGPEADTPPKVAPDTSVRPKARPAQPVPPKAPAPSEAPQVANQSADPEQMPKPKPKPQPEAEGVEQTQPKAVPEVEQDAIEAALRDVLEATAKAAEPNGPKLTDEEINGLKNDVRQCWIIDRGSPVSNVKLTVAMSMKPDGKVEVGSLRMIGGEGGSDRIIKTAFQVVRRAILRCQKTGYDLPQEKYDRWREIEITFELNQK